MPIPQGRNNAPHPSYLVEDCGLVCPVCERDHIPVEYMSNHHLRTKKVDKNHVLYLCRDCHAFIHALFSNKWLANPRKKLDSLKGLLERPEYVKAVSFIKKVPVGRKVNINASRGRGNRTTFSDPMDG